MHATSRRLIALAFAFAGCVLTPALSLAQQTWAVALTAGRDPLPIGACSAIGLTIFDPAIRAVPRNRLGDFVTMADFDITVTAADGTSVAAQHIDPSHVSACGCQGAAAGTVATVTATYPAASLADAVRITGVAFQKTTTFTLTAREGTTNPPACLIAREIVTLTPLTSVTGVRVPGTTVAAAAPVPVNPSGFTAVQTGPGQVQLSWQPVSGATFYGLFGPGLTAGGERVTGATTVTASAVPGGSQQWSLGSFYDPGPISTAAAAFSKTTLNVTAPVPAAAAAAPAAPAPVAGGAPMWAKVAADGTVVAKSAGVGGVRFFTYLGLYDVSFDRDVSGCASIATAAASTTSSIMAGLDNYSKQRITVRLFQGYDLFGPKWEKGAFSLVVYC